MNTPHYPNPDRLMINLVNIKQILTVTQIKEIKQRKQNDQRRTQISREMNIPKPYVNMILGGSA